MAKKEPKSDRTPRMKTPLSPEQIEAMAEDIHGLIKKLSEIAQNMRARKISDIETLGYANWIQGFEKMRSSTNSIERAYAERNTQTIKRKVAETRAKHGQPESGLSGEQ